MSGAAAELRRAPALTLAGLSFALLLGLALLAPEHLPAPDMDRAYAGPMDMPPFGGDNRGRALLDYAAQGARVVALPAVSAGLFVALFAVLGGLLRAMGLASLDNWIQGLGEVVGALPRMVVILVVALLLPPEARGLLPLALTWALLSAPNAADEAAAVAERLGGARFVEALRAHGYSGMRIFGYHVVALNLRPVVVRQAAEVMMQVVFLEIALSYLALAEDQPSFTHGDNVKSWADLLSMGYPSLVMDMPTGHALALGMGLIALVAITALAIGRAARAR
jgi:ABC-type dipeptide/oligopeptide/nickel transport system permease subunit